MLALAQPRDGGGLPGIAKKLESTDTLQGDDFPLRKRSSRIGDRDLKLRSTRGTRIRLRVKTPVRRILIFLATLRAEHEVAHCRIRPVVGDVDHDRVPWSTV